MSAGAWGPLRLGSGERLVADSTAKEKSCHPVRFVVYRWYVPVIQRTVTTNGTGTMTLSHRIRLVTVAGLAAIALAWGCAESTLDPLPLDITVAASRATAVP